MNMKNLRTLIKFYLDSIQILYPLIVASICLFGTIICFGVLVYLNTITDIYYYSSIALISTISIHFLILISIYLMKVFCPEILKSIVYEKMKIDNEIPYESDDKEEK